MPILDSIKGSFVKAAVEKLTHGDSGSTILGVVAAGLMSSNIDFSKIVQGFHSQDTAMECGKAAAIVAMVTWGYFIGKKKTPPTS